MGQACFFSPKELLSIVRGLYDISEEREGSERESFQKSLRIYVAHCLMINSEKRCNTWSLNSKQYHNWNYLQGSNGDMDIENRLTDTAAGGGMRGGMHGESNVEAYIAICKIDSQWEFAVWLRELTSGLCNNLEGSDGEGGSRGRRHMYTWASLVAQSVKKLPAVQETRFNPWFRKMPWRRKWQPTPVFLPGEPHGQGNLAGYSPWCHKIQTWLRD